MLPAKILADSPNRYVIAMAAIVLPVPLLLMFYLLVFGSFFPTNTKVVFLLDLIGLILFTVISCLSALSAWADCSHGYTGFNYSPLIEMEFMVAVILT